MSASASHEITSYIPQIITALPGITTLPWPGPFRYIPQAVQLKVIEFASNRLLKDQLLAGDLQFLEKVSLRIQIKDMEFDWAATIKDNRLVFSSGKEGAETTFSGNSKEFILLASRREDPDTLFFQRRLSIEGNTELGLQVKNLIDSIDFDEFPDFLHRSLYLAADIVEALPKSASVG